MNMRVVTLGIALTLIGIAVFGFTLYQLVNGSALGPQAKVPGKLALDVDEPGRYYLWDNHWTVFEGKRWKYAADFPADAQISIQDDDANVLEFVRDDSESWSIGNHSKTSIGYVDVMRPATLTANIDGVSRERIVSISNQTLKQDLWSRLGGFGIGLAIGLIGVPLTLLGFFLEGKVAPKPPKLP